MPLSLRITLCSARSVPAMGRYLRHPPDMLLGLHRLVRPLASYIYSYLAYSCATCSPHISCIIEILNYMWLEHDRAQYFVHDMDEAIRLLFRRGWLCRLCLLPALLGPPALVLCSRASAQPAVVPVRQFLSFVE